MFMGVIGKSILNELILEDIVLNSFNEDIFFVSGSTKTVEYSHLSDYIKNLVCTKKINNLDCDISFTNIVDPQSKIEKGSVVSLKIYDKVKVIRKNLYLLGNLTPINFSYYGVPSKAIDPIISLLLKVSLGVYDKYQKNINLEKGLYTVDFNVDEWGNLI